ncbi:unnamed protein product [Adineta steineri]|uniref:Uncharacterized protein n=1 Tax=Adineta steineri TaxID=433720 RepID=A0A816CUH2_9BILA|nr:unnamed protein product [Adineta steineri]CAF1626392.1 unnamed protein product [Adineta steineri]
MGTLLGHIVPGTFFTIFAVWWGFCIAIKHYHLRNRTRKSSKSHIYHSTTTFTCLCCPSSDKIPIESYVKIFCAIIGMLGEFFTGFTHLYNDTLKRKTWGFGENNAQHITMFLGFGLASLFEIFVHLKYSLPDGIDFLVNILAYGIQGFLFHFHLHGRNEIDIHVHTLLVYAISFCVLAAIWEYNRPNQILATYARIAGTFLQGVWFHAIGFILYFPSNDPYWIWSPSHGHILLITVIFIWISLAICIFLFLQSTIIWTTEHKEYFSQSTDESIIKRPKHTSYDHIGQKRALHLSKILRAFLIDRIGSGEIGDILAGKNFELTNIIIPVDLNRIEILWWSSEQEAPIIEDLLKSAGEELKTAIRYAQLLPNLPPVIFKRDNAPAKRDHINHLLDTADMGSSEIVTPPVVTERTDLYDSDRTVILRKLSIDENKTMNNEDEIDTNQLSVEQLQRRMKAFALTKRMKRVQEQRSAVYGLMAIEKEKENQEHFALHETIDTELERK